MKFNEIKESEFLNILGDPDFIYETPVPEISKSEIEKTKEKINEILNKFSNKKLCVLGIDTYKYSLRPLDQQILLPLVLKDAFKKTKNVLIANEAFLFGTKDDIEIPFIDQGDGGFYIFNTPLHALTFAIWFECILRFYNSYHFNTTLRSVIDSITVRYSITFDNLINIDNNFYGPAIINSSRILSKDKLNRFLADNNIIEWFLKNFNGIENLQYFSTTEIEKISNKVFPDYIYKSLKFNNSIYSLFKDKHYGIKSCDIQHIGEIEVKDRFLSVFNIYMQVCAGIIPKLPEHEEVKITASLGNLNSVGL